MQNCCRCKASRPPLSECFLKSCKYLSVLLCVNSTCTWPTCLNCCLTLTYSDLLTFMSLLATWHISLYILVIPVSAKERIYLLFPWDLPPLIADLRMVTLLCSIHVIGHSYLPSPFSGNVSWSCSKEESVAAVPIMEVVSIMEEIRESFLKDMLSEVSREQISSLQFFTTQNPPSGKCWYFV